VSEVDAELARSILACPDSAEVAVDGFPSVGCDDDLGLRDQDGTPTSSSTWTSSFSAADGERVRVPLREFRSPALRLNRGYLQRALEHANDCHREDLAQVVARTAGAPAEHLLDVSLAELTNHCAELSWIDREGGQRVTLWFSRPARSVEELGVLLRRELHAGIC
jgi:hypothetical protein